MRSPADGDVVGVFAKAPVPGYVKTRLAAEMGPAAAVNLYREVGRAVIAGAAGVGYPTVVWYAPAGKRPALRPWLDGIAHLRFQAQPTGDLGRRLQHAFARHFAEGASRVVIVGTDCPGVTARVVARAFETLESADVVV
jgi:glycosyltransferase A (GT-A) superfamily protein (DUF2064 family)